MYKWIVDLRWNRQSLRIANLNLNPGIVGMESGFGWTWGKKKNGFPTRKCLLFICVIVKHYLSSYFQENPSYFLYTILFEKWNVKYSDTFSVMYVPRILPYVIVNCTCTRFSFLRNHFSPKKFANVWYFIHATFHSKSSKNEKNKNSKYIPTFCLLTPLFYCSFSHV